VIKVAIRRVVSQVIRAAHQVIRVARQVIRAARQVKRATVMAAALLIRIRILERKQPALTAAALVLPTVPIQQQLARMTESLREILQSKVPKAKRRERTKNSQPQPQARQKADSHVAHMLTLLLSTYIKLDFDFGGVSSYFNYFCYLFTYPTVW
jgi:hypothetical protein